MQPNIIWTIFDRFYQRNVTSRDQLLNEMLRMKLTEKAAKANNLSEDDNGVLYRLMKQTTESDLGFFPADQEFFNEIYIGFKGIDPVEFALEIFKNDKSGTITAPTCVTEYMTRRAKDAIVVFDNTKVLITEAEKHLAGLKNMVAELQPTHITLTTQLYQMKMLLELVFDGNPMVTIVNESIYSVCLVGQEFDYICCVPSFGGLVDGNNEAFFTRHTDGVALENMPQHLKYHGKMAIVLPARVTFSGSGYANLRNHIASKYAIENIYLMPEGVFKPYSAIKAYFLTLSKSDNENMSIGSLGVKQDEIVVDEDKTIPKSEFLAHEDWRIELMLAQDDVHIQRFKSSQYAKAKLSEVAEVFRGKSILKKDVSVGKVAILNISNIQNGEIDYADMDTTDEDIRKNKRYELEDNDVVLSCRGTAIKVAVFHSQDRPIIASANVIIIRPNKQVLGEFIKVFIESPVGLAMIKSLQRGTAIINFNHSDVMEMEIPVLPLEKQRGMIDHYRDEQRLYKEAVRSAEEKWNRVKEGIYDQLI